MDQSYPFFSPLKTRSDAKSWLLLRRIQDACESCLINWCHSFFFCMNTFTLKSCLSRCSCLINTVSVFRKRSLATDVRVCRMPGLRLLVCRVFCCMPVLLLFHTAKKKKKGVHRSNGMYSSWSSCKWNQKHCKYGYTPIYMSVAEVYDLFDVLIVTRWFCNTQRAGFFFSFYPLKLPSVQFCVKLNQWVILLL